MGNAREQLTVELERPPTTEELAEKTELSTEEVEELLKVAGDDLSLSTAVGGGRQPGAGRHAGAGHDALGRAGDDRSSFEEQIRALVEELDDKEREVIRMRFGLDGEEPRTLQEIGEELGLSRERIRQIEARRRRSCAAATRAQRAAGVPQLRWLPARSAVAPGSRLVEKDETRFAQPCACRRPAASGAPATHLVRACAVPPRYEHCTYPDFDAGNTSLV